MFNYTMKAGVTSKSLVLRIIDAIDGTPETGVVFNTAGIDLQYRREGAASVAITEATLAALTTAWASGGFLHIGNGYYRLDIPDAALAAGADGVLVHGVVTGMVVIGCYVQLVAYDPFDAVRLGLTTLPNAAAEAAGGLYTRGTGAGQINQPANGRVDANTVAVSGTTQTARDLGASVLVSSGTGVGQLNVTSGVVQTSLVQILGTALAGTAAQMAAAFTKFFDKAAPTGTINSLPDAVAGAAGGLFLAGTNAATTVTGALTTTFTGNMTGTVAGVTGAVGSVTAGVTLAALESWVAHSGTSQAGAGSTITLAAGANATDNFYTGMLLKIYGGTGIGQARTILSYVGATKVATLDRAWITTPDNTSTYAVLWADQPKVDAALQTTTASVVGNVGGSLVGTIGGLAAQAKTDVNAEVLDVLTVDTFTEPGQGAPGVNVSLKDKIGFLYKAFRNKITQDSTTLSIYADDTSTVDHKATVSDSGTVYTRNEITTGP